MNRLYAGLFFLLSINGFCQPNSDSAISKARVDKYYMKSYLKDYRDILTSPFKPSVKKIVGAGVYAGTMYMLISQYDEKIQLFSQKQRTPFANNVSKYVFEPMGGGIYPLIVIASFYTQGVLWNNQKSKKVAMNCVKSFIIAGSFTQVGKFAFSRQGPLVDTPDANKWFKGNPNRSFFSGHTTTAFSIATVIAEEYKETIWVPVVSYSLATCAGLSRIHDNAHWASDVLTGALVGYLTGKLIVCKNNWGINIIPGIIIP
ncbi:MAG TPA: phosphatase PAP2 family protein [Bacteroidales bacterium]